ncbi:MAG: hypothetical protein ACRDZX_17475 [Acidimicrobiales bacterium]
MLQKPASDRVPARLPSVARAAASPTAIVLAGAGVAVGEAAHLGLAATVVLGAVGYGGKVTWAWVHRRLALRRRARRRLARIDPWSVPDPWRTFTTRALDARKRARKLARDCASGPVGAYLAEAAAQVDAAVEEQWRLARSGAALAGPPGGVQKVSGELSQVQADLVRAVGADRVVLARREDALASELRSLRRTEAVSGEVAAQLAGLCSQLEGMVAAAAELVVSAGTSGADLGLVTSGLTALAQALGETRRPVGAPSSEAAPPGFPTS